MNTKIFFLLVLIGFSQAASLANSARASDAVDSALDVLRGLKQTNIDAQAFADAVNKTREAEMKAEIDDLTAIADSNKANGDAATEHRKYLQNELEVTNANLRWIVARREELIRKRSELQEQRCVASMQFVKALKEHDEALQVVDMLKRDVVGIVEEHTGETYEGFAQIQDQAQKLSAYAHLFNSKAMEAFSQLTQSNPAQAVDAETAQWDDNASDNQKKALEVQHGYQGTENRDVAHRFIDMINDLQQHLIDSVADLKKNEIQAAWDLVNWMQESEKELQFLDEDQAAKTIYMDKLTINIVGAKNHEDRLWEIYFESATVLNDSLAKREKIRQNYMDEKARRDEENIILDGIIQMFIDQVAILNGKLRAGATDYQDDGSFNSSQGNYNDDRVDAMYGDVAATNAAANRAANAAPYL